MCASGDGHLDCVKDLLDKGAEVNMQMKVSALLVGPFCLIYLPLCETSLFEDCWAVKLCVLV